MVSALARGKVYGHYPLRSTFSEDKQHLFDLTPHGYRLIKGLRDLIIFAPHDLLHQPPFPQLDLVVCHHPLSQLSVEEQATLLNRFAYVLSARCHLFLVSDPTVLPNAGYYERIDSSRQVYVRTEMPVPIQTLRLQHTRAPRENADTSQYTADLDLVEELQVALAVCRREGKPPFFLPPGPRGWHKKPSAFHLVAEMGLTINTLPHTFVLSDKLLETVKPDLILLDLMMPEMDGFTFVEELQRRELDSFIPILVMTAGAHVKARSEQMGLHNYLEKPFDLFHFLDLLTRLLYSVEAC